MGGDVVRPLSTAVADGGTEAGVPPPAGAVVPAVAAGGPVAGRDVLAVASGADAVGVGPTTGGGDGLVAGRGRSSAGPDPEPAWGSRASPTPSPVTARAEPPARHSIRDRRRARMPSYRRCRCSGRKGACCGVSRIMRVSSCSKSSIASPLTPRA